MARKSVLNYVFRNLLALALTISLAIVDAEAKGGGKGSQPTSSSSSGSGKSKTTKIKDKKTGITQCYNEHMVKIVCPINKTEAIAMGVIGGIVGAILLVVLYIKIEAKLRSRKEAREAQGRDLESGAAQQAFDSENGGARRDSSLSDVPPPQYVEKAANEPEKELVSPPFRGHVGDSNLSGSTITPPIISIPIPELTKPSDSPESPITTSAATQLLPMTATMPAKKDTLANKFKNVLQKFKRITTK